VIAIKLQTDQQPEKYQAGHAYVVSSEHIDFGGKVRFYFSHLFLFLVIVDCMGTRYSWGL